MTDFYEFIFWFYAIGFVVIVTLLLLGYVHPNDKE